MTTPIPRDPDPADQLGAGSRGDNWLPGAILDVSALTPEQLQPAAVKPPPPPPTVPAGWYPDPDNATGFRYGSVPSMRYFDGIQWTENRAPMQRTQKGQQGHQAPQQPIIIAQQIAPPTPPHVVVYNNGTSHGLHLVLTVLTCGMWLPIWIIVAIVNGGR
jgi:hypothetical protein